MSSTQICCLAHNPMNLQFPLEQPLLSTFCCFLGTVDEDGGVTTIGSPLEEIMTVPDSLLTINLYLDLYLAEGGGLRCG